MFYELDQRLLRANAEEVHLICWKRLCSRRRLHSSGGIGMVTTIQLLTTFFPLPLQASVIHCAVPSPSNTSLIFRNVYKCQQAGGSPGESAGSRQVWSSPGWVTLKPECWERAKHSPPRAPGLHCRLLLLREPDTGQWQERTVSDGISHIISSSASLRCAGGARSQGCAGEGDRLLFEASVPQ